MQGYFRSLLRGRVTFDFWCRLESALAPKPWLQLSSLPPLVFDLKPTWYFMHVHPSLLSLASCMSPETCLRNCIISTPTTALELHTGRQRAWRLQTNILLGDDILPSWSFFDPDLQLRIIEVLIIFVMHSACCSFYKFTVRILRPKLVYNLKSNPYTYTTRKRYIQNDRK